MNIHDFNELVYLLRRCRAVLNLAGYIDMVEKIDALLERYGYEIGA